MRSRIKQRRGWGRSHWFVWLIGFEMNKRAEKERHHQQMVCSHEEKTQQTTKTMWKKNRKSEFEAEEEEAETNKEEKEKYDDKEEGYEEENVGIALDAECTEAARSILLEAEEAVKVEEEWTGKRGGNRESK